MRIKTTFWILTLVLAVLFALFTDFFVLAYHTRYPVLQRLFYRADAAAGTDASAGPYAIYPGLKPGKLEPDGHYYRDRVLVLMYHDLSPSATDRSELPVSRFARQLELMKENNFHWITMDDYRDFILHDKPVPENAVLLTFDDGYESMYKYAYPLLRKYNAPAAGFLIVDTVGNAKTPGVPKLTWDQVKEMSRGGIGFYNHTFYSHYYGATDAAGKRTAPALARRLYLKSKGRRETEQEYEARIETDLNKANAILRAKLGTDNHVLAFPYGAFSKPLLRICRQEGIDVTLTVKSGINGPGQTNGFRLNAGGMQNDPDLQIALMKGADRWLGHAHFDRTPLYKREALAAAAGMVVAFAGWTFAGAVLLRRRAQRRGKAA